MPSSPDIGLRIAAVRRFRSMSQSQLAAAIGVSKSVVAHWEHARAKVDVVRLIAIARALRCRPDDLLRPLSEDLPRRRASVKETEVVRGLSLAAVRGRR